ncbi:uncharacterized protein LACBIDRAFT_317325 [Laccaria bicolor S238N-H82]|uniref:Predicted protein n=1 Tax=Laccaria bicolor (strain S238N-H82 / ATCC MYA-4686) TaxID=486041 RepID=B0D4X5_LACBS|nr:uncharacterized protein LACBIDRAFT_317325 [Laccaria bicolor S238N-H82]EDR10418.1 predicted protein [Laccaria bicolor S238N-H82]|eukprot:XP_001878868.1 predicted protein [Laccaria bicolor S238N-H82]
MFLHSLSSLKPSRTTLSILTILPFRTSASSQLKTLDTTTRRLSSLDLEFELGRQDVLCWPRKVSSTYHCLQGRVY